jgi:peptidoglycan/xylan/chitin deacetylase (PgdA/CDA1 family)
MKRAICISIFLMIGAILGLWQVSKARSFQLFGEIVSNVDCAEPVVALTFDDGPTRQYIDEVLSILHERKVKATFFVTGRETEINIDEARRIVAEGHELGNHSYSHSRLVLKGPNRIRDEIERTDKAIRNAGQQGSIHFRPPYCKKLLMLPWYLSRTGRITVTCDVEPESFTAISKEASLIVTHVLERVQPGSIILLHVMYDSRAESRKALPAIIDGLRERDYEFVTVSELLSKDAA